MSNFADPPGSRAMTKVKIIILLMLGVAILLLTARREGVPVFAISHENSAVSVPRWNGKTIVVTEKTGEHTDTGETPEPPPRLKPLFFQPIPINESDYELLLTIPGVGPSTATEILKTRMAEGSFDSADDLVKVKGIGAKKKEHLRAYVTF